MRVLILAMMLVGSVAFAQRPLKDVMKEMGQNIGPIRQALVQNKPVPQQVLIEASEALLRLSIESQGLTPELANTPEKLATYRSLMADLETALQVLSNAIKINDRAMAASVLQSRVFPLIQRGHELFRPPPEE